MGATAEKQSMNIPNHAATYDMGGGIWGGNLADEPTWNNIYDRTYNYSEIDSDFYSPNFVTPQSGGGSGMSTWIGLGGMNETSTYASCLVQAGADAT